MMRTILQVAVAGAVVLLAVGCTSEGTSGNPMTASREVRLGAGDAMGARLYQPVTGVFAMRAAAAHDVSVAGVRKDE